MRRVMLGTAIHGSISSEGMGHWAHSFANTLRLSYEVYREEFEVRELIMCGDSLVQNARNDIIGSAVANKMDDLIFIDADQDWEAEWFYRLLSHPVDCVGAPIRKKTDEHETYNVKTADIRNLRTDPETGLMTAPDMAVGTGFLRLSRKALLALWERAEPYRIGGPHSTRPPTRWIFDVRPVDGVLMSEDTHVCETLRQAGIATWVDPSMVPGHWGSKCYAGDFRAWLQRQLTVAAEEKPKANGRHPVEYSQMSPT